jgi:ferrous iron transport protein A
VPPGAAGSASFSLLRAARGQQVVVVEVIGGDGLAHRLAACGLWPGTRIEWIGRAPFGDPLLFRLHGYRLALRRSEADRVLVRVVEVSR